MLPFGGWERIDFTAFASRLRVIHKWVDNDGNILVAFLCEEHCYVDTGDGVLIDITPIDGIAAPPGVGEGGYGDGLYGEGDYGESPPGVSRSIIATPSYTLDNWGEELRAMTSADGRLLYWTPAAPSTELSAVPNAPSGRTFVVTPERHIMIFEADAEPGRVEWSDEEDDTEWTPGTTTKAGGFNVEPRSPIISARVGPGGIFFSTARSAHLTRWVGSPYIYSTDTWIANCPPPLSAASIVPVPEGLMWLAVNGFWIFNGVGCYPLECAVWEWVRKQFNIPFSRFFAAAMPNPAKFEVWFNFVSTTGSINDRLVAYNYRNKIWTMGHITRLCGAAFESDANPLMSDGEFVYRHEINYDYPGVDELPWADTFAINTGNGSLKSTINQMLPEIIAGNPNAVAFKFYAAKNPTRDEETESTLKQVRSNGYVDVRFSGRDLRMRTQMVLPEEWSLGTVQMDLKGRGTK